MAPERKNRKSSDIPLSEWIAAIIGAALVVASIGVLVYTAVTTADAPARLSLRVVSIENAGEEFLVQIEIANNGGSTAADAHIEAELRQQEEVVQRSETTVDFVPPNSTRRAAVLFSQDPRARTLKLRTLGYRDP
jgi:uncharacterized protein (TIGR02588 family)